MTLLGTFILFAGVIDDLRSRKVHNYLVVILFVISFLTVFILSGFSGLMTGLFSFLLALAFGFPLYLAKVVGGGDVKLFAVFGFATNINIVFHVAVFSLVWGALLGVARAALSGQLRSLILSTTQLLWTKSPGAEDFRIPFTVALFFGWLTYISLSQIGISIW